MPTHPSFHRLELITGTAAIERLVSTRVALFGVGGVGSWCAEALIRSGIGHLTIVDSDLVCVTNINRQVQATRDTIGKSKVEELRKRLLSINPDAEISARHEIYCADTADTFDLGTFDFIIDAIDSVSAKVCLLDNALIAGVRVFSSFGASCKLDATRVEVSSIWKTHGCPLGKFVRKRLRKRLKLRGAPPGTSLLVVHSREMLPPALASSACGSGECHCPKFSEDGDEAHEWCSAKKQINGSSVQVTGTFGFTLAGLVIQEVTAAAGGPNGAPESLCEPEEHEPDA